ncbi:MAG: tryptophan 2,3-dioxygenase [Deltaproteobacteria bacterium]|nr:tryptophan 2,3-dioxygenase [Deltaproteobacteria bacterium]
MSADTPEGAYLDFQGERSYGDYLALDQILTAQRPVSDSHDEVLFIIQHQTTELWIKLCLHELRAARAHVRVGELAPAFKMLARVSRIFAQLVQAWDVLATLTPSEYLAFRDRLGRASGFQSYQYRMLEFLLGNKNPVLVRPHAHRPELLAQVEAELRAPSLYDEALRLLGRRGFTLDAACTDRDWTLPYQPNASAQAAWTAVYRDPKGHWDLYELAEELADLEDSFRQWRFRHVTTVERVIGFRRGTGGTAGVSYLRRMLDTRLFPELWDLRTTL